MLDLNSKKLAIGALLGASCLVTTPSLATTAFNGTLVSYAAPSVLAATGTITVPASQTTFSISTTAALNGSIAGQQFSVALPSGSTFAVVPTITVSSTGAVGCLTIAAAGTTGTANAANNTVTYSLTSGSSAGTCTASTITLSSYAVTGATSLQAEGASFKVSAGILVGGGSDGGFFSESAKSLQVASTSTSYLTVATAAPGKTDTISISATSLATKFIGSSSTSSASENVYANLGNITVGANALTAAGGGNFAAETAANVNVTSVLPAAVTGAFLLSGASAVCNATNQALSSTINGTLSTGSAGTTFQFSNVAVGSSTLCIQANGTGQLAPFGTYTVTSTGYAPVTTTLSVSDSAKLLNAITYASGTSELDLPYLAMASAGFDTFVRLVNQSASSQVVYGVLRADTGVTYPGVLVTIPAQSATLIGTAAIQTALQATSLAPSARAGLSLYGSFSTSSGGSVVGSVLQYSPSGVVSQTGRAY